MVHDEPGPHQLLERLLWQREPAAHRKIPALGAHLPDSIQQVAPIHYRRPRPTRAAAASSWLALRPPVHRSQTNYNEAAAM